MLTDLNDCDEICNFFQALSTEATANWFSGKFTMSKFAALECNEILSFNCIAFFSAKFSEKNYEQKSIAEIFIITRNMLSVRC